MARAITLSKRGFPFPNPHVGCVLVKDGVRVGEGFHAFAGGPHSEVVALEKAGDEAKGATAYVTLAPCNHHGRTPPCSEALIRAGVKRVVVSCDDPNPKSTGGIKRLRESNIDVEVGLMVEQAAFANRIFLRSIAMNRPYVIVKAGITLDGRIALPSGESKWITSEPSRKEAHRLRAECGAVLVGRGTVEADDPILTARLPGVKQQPIRIVLDPHKKLEERKYKVFDHQADTWHVTGEIHLNELLARLWKGGNTGLLVEGGARTIASFLREDLVDEIRLFVAPKIFGAGPTWTSEFGITTLAELVEFSFFSPMRTGTDVVLTAVRDRS